MFSMKFICLIITFITFNNAINIFHYRTHLLVLLTDSKLTATLLPNRPGHQFPFLAGAQYRRSSLLW